LALQNLSTTFWVAVLSLLLCGCGGQEQSPTATPNPVSSPPSRTIAGYPIGALLWSDDFIGTAGGVLDAKNWTPRNCGQFPSNGGGSCYGDEAQYYSPSAVALDGSTLGNAIITTTRISSQPSNAGSCPNGSCKFISARFDTQGKVAFKYGYIEARIKMPKGGANWPAFWMLGTNITSVGWPNSGELDIIELHGNRPSVATAATHYSTNNLPNTCCSNHLYDSAELDVGLNLTDDYHVYAIAWLPDRLIYLVDERVVLTSTPGSVRTPYWVFNQAFFLILNNAVGSFGGAWDGWFESRMVIDYVRSYQINGVGEVIR
jgi:beta-glucanase (GH16 family)